MRVVSPGIKVQRQTKIYVICLGGHQYLSKRRVPTDELANAEIFASWRDAAKLALDFKYGEVRVANLEVA